ncbi:DUF2156 domain-containing protein [Helicobacter baculiformis]|uniref:DUF2156 domain-containing protein n=1 Tax=Helicobacter baculiformis TaxID=427351 RepID=A0ABV7ZMB3_9HELI|nr:phosphatidylglycerol lysyltransferase domain-containing protein [Helicobacter baculiformis]
MEFKPLSLELKGLLDTHLQEDSLSVSDVNFTNLYLWQSARDIRLALVCGCVVIRTQYPKQPPFYFYPIGAGDKKGAITELLAHTKAHHEVLEFRALQTEQRAQLESFLPHAFDIEPQRDRFDYIYHTAELIALQGKKFHKKKNHLNAFLKEYPHFTYEPISAHNRDQIVSALREWRALGQVDEALEYEHQGILNALKVFEELQLQGGVIVVEGRIVGLSFGERISAQMAVIHIEKADPRVRGAYQMINQQLLAHAFKDCPLVNREEDLGIEGLRQAKMGYNPAFLLEKFHAIYKD